jgi:hypothetical protein
MGDRRDPMPQLELNRVPSGVAHIDGPPSYRQAAHSGTSGSVYPINNVRPIARPLRRTILSGCPCAYCRICAVSGDDGLNILIAGLNSWRCGLTSSANRCVGCVRLYAGTRQVAVRLGDCEMRQG